MKKSYVFTATESVLSDIERFMEDARNCLKSAIKALDDYEEECRENEVETDNYSLRYKKQEVDRWTIEVELWEQTYNYVYMNFHKLVKDVLPFD